MPQLVGPIPTVVEETREASLAEAQIFVQSFLAAAETRPQMHPDAVLAPGGPQFSTHGPKGGVVMHLLQRVERGLAGEVLAPEDLALEKEEAVADQDMTGTHTEDPHTFAQEQDFGDAAVEVKDKEARKKAKKEKKKAEKKERAAIRKEQAEE
ncbi:hypothetical protein EJ06DRAFT_27142 [Trichodelitschia bisporula]|uniref:Uncharacterized protein n=1 Tax=Trichodelitschia bisporula TaxID=703511 RepID=A0A6G1IBV1_9PEZI|nr:hypothetical protein EJ06DRAFT_27142 [Trichodelitschia bisporula]